jgi:hypothetical protein
MFPCSLTRRSTLTSFEELSSWWSRGGPRSLSHAVGGVSEQILIIFLVSLPENHSKNHSGATRYLILGS